MKTKNNMIEDRKGGSGTCPHCNEYVSNVAYHASNHCRQNPEIAERLKLIDEEHRRKIMGQMNMSREELFLDDIIKVCERYQLSLGHEDEHGGFLVVPYREDYSAWLKDARVKGINDE